MFGKTCAATNKDAASMDGSCSLELRLRLGSHLANHLRGRLEREIGYTATVGISVNKLLSKLIGNEFKPNAQTTLLPPYNGGIPTNLSNVLTFLDKHDIGKIPGIGFKISQKLRELVLGRPAEFQDGLVYGPSKESVSVGDVRNHPNLGPIMLYDILSGPGWPKDISRKVFEMIHGKDDSDVMLARHVPTQISIEDSYLRLNNMAEVRKQLLKLSMSLLKRMRVDLVEVAPDDARAELERASTSATIQWLAKPQVLRLSTRSRPPRNPDGSRPRPSFNRISRSGPVPPFLLAGDSMGSLSSRLVAESLLPMFRRLHPGKSGWDLSLINIAVTNIQQVRSTASNAKSAEGRDISVMLRSQHQDWASGSSRPIGHEAEPNFGWLCDSAETSDAPASIGDFPGSEDCVTLTQENSVLEGDLDNEIDYFQHEDICSMCGATVPSFALESHIRFHETPD